MDMIQPESWYAAASIPERLLHLPLTLGVELPYTAIRFKAWKETLINHDIDLFNEMLTLYGLTAEQFYVLLNQNEAALARYLYSQHSQWINDVSNRLVYQQLPNTTDTSLTSSALASFIQDCRTFLYSWFQNNSNSDFFVQDSLINGLINDLLQEYSSLVGRVLVLEMHIAGLEGILQESSVEDHFIAFRSYLLNPTNTLNILGTYPVLAYRIALFTQQWKSNIQLFLGRFVEDWSEIQQYFSIEQSRLESVEMNHGDPHNKGQHVVLLKFTNGQRLVYKPRCLSIALHFQELLTWFNIKGFPYPFKTLTVLPKAEYGWAEFIDFVPCKSLEEIPHFYYRMGGLLALIHILGGGDFHRENIIAHGACPVLVDLETLFRPLITDEVTEKAFYYSVPSIGMLPHRTGLHRQTEGYDISGLGGQQGQHVASVPRWDAIGTSAMHLIQGDAFLSEMQNRPYFNNQAFSAKEFVDSILLGFEEACHFLMQHRNEIMEHITNLPRTLTMRFLARHTMQYGEILDAALHPDNLMNGLDRDRLFDQLWLSVPTFWHTLAK